MTTAQPHPGLVAELVRDRTPEALRRLLAAPDPVALHDWQITPETFDRSVRAALEEMTR